MITRREALDKAFADFCIMFQERIEGVDYVLLSDFADWIWGEAIEQRDRELAEVRTQKALNKQAGRIGDCLEDNVSVPVCAARKAAQ